MVNVVVQTAVWLRECVEEDDYDTALLHIAALDDRFDVDLAVHPVPASDAREAFAEIKAASAMMLQKRITTPHQQQLCDALARFLQKHDNASHQPARSVPIVYDYDAIACEILRIEELRRLARAKQERGRREGR